jgi:hypothetical protein
MMNKIKLYILTLFTLRKLILMSYLSTLVYFLFKTLLFYSLKSPIGDETCFVYSNELIEKNGLYHELCLGKISPLFSILSTFLNYFINDILIIYRIITAASTIAMLLLIYHFAKNKLKISGYYLQSILILFISFLAFRIYWQGINDALFHLLIVISFYLIYEMQFKKNKIKILIYIGIVFGLMISTRFLAFIVIPCFVFFFYNSFKNIFIVGITTIAVSLLFHSPSLINGNGLSDQDKEPNNGMNWVQLNYLSQKLIYEIPMI